MTGAAQPGAFGKIPSHGDFIRFDLPQSFIRAWDDWLQGALVVAREKLGDDWEALYMSAPIWRFSLPAGMAGQQGISGVLMPSVDRVGRQYPLTLAVTAPAGGTALRHFSNLALFERLETIALETLDQDLPRDALADALSALDLKTPSPPPGPGDVYRGAVAPEAILAASRIEQMFDEVALWTSGIGDDHRMLLTRTLPDNAQFTALFDPGASLWHGSAPQAAIA
jgi:type VI secretion system protein ImpM